MSSDLDVIRRIIEAFERSDWQEIDVRSGALRVRLASSAPADASSPTETPQGRVEDDDAGAERGPEPDPAQRSPTHERSVPAGAHIVTSPSPGIFWRAPEPGAPPFTDVGGRIEPSSTLCIIEVMKLMNHVKAGVAGEVVAIFAENGAAVDKDEPLFAVRTGGSGR